MSDKLFDISSIGSWLTQRKQRFENLLRTEGVSLEDSNFWRNAVKDLGNGLLAASDDSEEAPTLDTSKLKATFTITTSRKDRYGDIVLPRGCESLLSNYKRNPQFLFAHRTTELPIAQVRNPETKECELQIFDDRIVAPVYFHELTPESRVMWRFVANKILTATSIGFLPVKASIIGSEKTEEELEDEYRKRRKEKNDEGERVLTFEPWLPLRFMVWDLLEVSLVPIPANPDCVDAVSSVLSKGVVDGEKIPYSIRKSLEVVIPPSTSISVPVEAEIKVLEAPVIVEEEAPVVVQEEAPKTDDLLLEILALKDCVLECKACVLECKEHIVDYKTQSESVRAALSELKDCYLRLEEWLKQEEPDPKVDASLGPVLEAIQQLDTNYGKLSDKFFSLTGKRI